MGLFKKILYKLVGTSEELEAIFQEKGYCDEWIECYCQLHPNLSFEHKTTLADVFTSLGKYREAEEILNSIKITMLDNDDTRGMYYLQWLNLYAYTHRTAQAADIMQKNQKFLDIYFTSPARERMGGAYFDAAAITAALVKNSAAAQRYYEFELQWAKKHDETGIYPKVTKVHLLNLFEQYEQAQQEAEATKAYIESYSGFKYHWQKDAMLRLLEKVHKFEIENTQSCCNDEDAAE